MSCPNVCQTVILPLWVPGSSTRQRLVNSWVFSGAPCQDVQRNTTSPASHLHTQRAAPHHRASTRRPCRLHPLSLPRCWFWGPGSHKTQMLSQDIVHENGDGTGLSPKVLSFRTFRKHTPFSQSHSCSFLGWLHSVLVWSLRLLEKPFPSPQISVSSSGA